MQTLFCIYPSWLTKAQVARKTSTTSVAAIEVIKIALPSIWLATGHFMKQLSFRNVAERGTPASDAPEPFVAKEPA